MSRVLLNNPKLAKQISRNFIPFAGSVERLQPSRYGGKETSASRWFQRHAKRAFEEFERGQSAFDANPPPQSSVSNLAGSRPLTAPPGTSVLRVFSRIRPLPSGAPKSNRGIGRDHMWVSAEEVEFMLKGGKLPESFVARLLRFQILDNVRNVSPGFDGNDLQAATFESKLEGNLLKLEGSWKAEGRTNGGQPFGMRATVRGVLQLDGKSKRITRCRLFAEATAHGESTAEAPKKPYRMVFGVVEATDSVARTVPPTTYGISPLFRQLYLHPRLPARLR